MPQSNYKLRKIKYQRKDSEGSLFADVKRKKDLYFAVNGISRYGNRALLYKTLLLVVAGIAGYFLILNSTSYFQLQAAYFLLGGSWLLLGINLGHDAAHNCLTGNKKFDNNIFELIFGIQGINGYLWKIRHNHSHHPFPNVYEYDSDMEITNLFYLSPNQRKKKIHYYQHIYAPLMYMFISLIWIFYIDFKIFRKKDLANMTEISHSKTEFAKLILFKLASLTFFLFIPLIFSALPTWQIFASFIIMHLVLSMLLTFIFFVSHHVRETAYETSNNGMLSSSWVEQQVASTLDFHAESKVANFIFGGFNAHVAHHLFPDVCHIHYPVLTSLIKQSLEEHHIKYNSLSFVKAVGSHLTHLKNITRT